MQVQINTDSNIEGNNALTQHIETVVRDALKRFGGRITRVEIHLSDENSNKKVGVDDKRCLMEVRLASLQPIVTTHHASTIELAVNGAAEIMIRTIDSTLGRLS